jgi:glycosyltransferase involved in cell wall biosynthesis
MTRPIKVAFLTYRLQVGGAERQLCLLAKSLDRTRFEPFVISVYDGGPLELELQGTGVRIVSPKKSGRMDIIGFWRRLVSIVRQERPDIIYSMSDYANVLNQLLRLGHSRHLTVWGLRASDNRPLGRGVIWYGVFVLGRILSRWADHTISNSNAGLEYYKRAGFHLRAADVVPNGIGTNRFAPDPTSRQRIRREWSAENAFVVGFLARILPKKDLSCFLAAAEKTHPSKEVLFVVVGSDASAYAREIKKKVTDPRVLWLGERHDVADVMNGFDMYCLTSAYGEGHPNTLGEAMAVGRIVAASNCGDSRNIVGDDHWIFEPGDSDHLASLMHHALHLSPERRSKIERCNRSRAIETLSTTRLTESTERILERSLDQAVHARTTIRPPTRSE